MHYTTFEQFCWWLLKKDETFVGCYRLGGIGKTQDGIDLFAIDKQHPQMLHVFECKAWKRFSATRLKDAVDAFLKGGWANRTKRITIIIGQPSIEGTPLAHRWIIDRERLKQAGIDGELWTGDMLTLKVQLFPDILSKFFPWHSVEVFANQWMQRVGFHELVSKSLFDPRKEVADWACEMLGRSEGNVPVHERQTGGATDASGKPHNSGPLRKPSLAIDGNYRQIHSYDSSWIFKGPWFAFDAILPSPRFPRMSAAINFNRPDLRGMTLTFDHTWLLRRFLFAVEAPLDREHRATIVGVDDRGSENTLPQYYMDFPHCRLVIDETGAAEILGVADLLTDVVRDALRKLEATWGATDFPFVTWAGNKVALATIDKRVWREIGQFSEEHDVARGTTQWHMFDGNREVLKPFHNTRTEQFDAGYHGVFYAAEVSGLSYGDSVVILWQPNGIRPDEPMSRRGWWSCTDALEWLSESLLPQVKRDIYERNSIQGWRRLLPATRSTNRDFLQRLDELYVLRDLRKPPLMRDGRWTMGLLKTVQTLQGFFNGFDTPQPFIRKGEMEALFHELSRLAKGRRGTVGYVANSLSLRRHPRDHEDLACAIKEHIDAGRVVTNYAVADYAFRAMLELLDDSDAWLSAEDRWMTFASIEPFAHIRDDAVLVDRHSK